MLIFNKRWENILSPKIYRRDCQYVDHKTVNNNVKLFWSGIMLSRDLQTIKQKITKADVLRTNHILQ